jgi:sulfopropanediol 3-dehydrogenase
VAWAERGQPSNEEISAMRLYKDGGHRLFERDQETTGIVSEMLLDLEAHGLAAARRYSQKFDAWDPANFELSTAEIEAAISRLDRQVVEDTAYCQANVRRFAQAQRATMLPLEIETEAGVILGHRHIPVQSVGSYIPGGRYPMLAHAITARVRIERYEANNG